MDLGRQSFVLGSVAQLPEPLSTNRLEGGFLPDPLDYHMVGRGAHEVAALSQGDIIDVDNDGRVVTTPPDDDLLGTIIVVQYVVSKPGVLIFKSKPVVICVRLRISS